MNQLPLSIKTGRLAQRNALLIRYQILGPCGPNGARKARKRGLKF